MTDGNIGIVLDNNLKEVMEGEQGELCIAGENVARGYLNRYTFFRQLGCLAFSLRFCPKIKQFLSNCPASDLIFLQKTANFNQDYI